MLFNNLWVFSFLLAELAALEPFLDPAYLTHRLLYPLAKLILAMAVGLLMGNLIEGAGLSRRLGRFAIPLLRWGHLQESSAAAFTTALASSVAANTMLMNSYQDKSITRQELILSALVLTLPTYLLHLPTTFFIITPFVGRIGVVYLVILLAAALLRTFLFLAYGRLTLPEPAACPGCARFAQHRIGGRCGGRAGPSSKNGWAGFCW